MADFKGKPVELNAAPEVVFARLSDFSNLNEKLEELPAEMREAIGEVRFTPDSIIINAAPAGEMTLAITERIEPSRIVLSAVGSPVPLAMTIYIAPGQAGGSVVSPVAEVQIPPMLKPFVGPKMQEAADKFGDMLRTLFNSSKA